MTSTQIIQFALNKSEVDDRFGTAFKNLNSSPVTSAMVKSSFSTYSAEVPSLAMSDFKMVVGKETSPILTSSSGSTGGGSSGSSVSGPSLVNAIAQANKNPIDTSSHGHYAHRYNMMPYFVEKAFVQKGTDAELAQWSPQKGKQRSPSRKKKSKGSKSRRISAHKTPKVTAASVPFERTIPPTSLLREELSKDPAYAHALTAGTLWQSLIGQHVKLPAIWYDGEEPARPYLGCEDRLKRNKWSYFGRHRVAGDQKLNALVRDSSSSGKLLLHIICTDSESCEATEDIVVGVFHPNADGVRDADFTPDHRRHDDFRDVWIGHRSRSVPHQGRRIATRIESLLRYLNNNKVDKCPLGHRSTPKGTPASKYSVDNKNMNAVFGHRPPRHTIFVPEETLHSLLMLKLNKNAPSPPPSVILLRNFLR